MLNCLDAPGIKEIQLDMEGSGRGEPAGVKSRLPVWWDDQEKYWEMQEGVI